MVPYVLFLISLERLPPILAAADSPGCGLENSGRHAELYVDDLWKLHAFASSKAASLGTTVSQE